jgi:hypothetical protein
VKLATITAGKIIFFKKNLIFIYCKQITDKQIKKDNHMKLVIITAGKIIFFLNLICKLIIIFTNIFSYVYVDIYIYRKFDCFNYYCLKDKNLVF